MDRNHVVLVTEEDVEIGIMEKMEAHQKGLLHRAFSVLIYNSADEILLQQRAFHKYHSGGLWTNATCSHPKMNENIINAGKERLFEEMGINCDLSLKSKFKYKCNFSNGLIENELDYILVGKTHEKPIINKEEVNDYKWINKTDLLEQIKLNPEKFTYWFLEIVKQNLI